MTSDHPSFASPTIQEAICEIHFALPEGREWESHLFGIFYKQIEAEFPELEPVTETGMQIQLRSGKVGIAPARSRMRYRHATRNLLLQLSQGVMTVNVLSPYPGWQQMQADIVQAWNWADEVLQPSAVTRVGLRYINFVPLVAPEEKPGDWIAKNPYVADAVLSSDPGFLSRIEVRYGQGRRSIVTVAEVVAQEDVAQEGSEKEEKQLAIDIDCIQDSTDDEPLVLDGTVDALHETAWSIFHSFITPRLRSLLEGEQ